MKQIHAITQLVLVALLIVNIFRRTSSVWICWVAAAVGMTVFIMGVASVPPRFNDYEIFLDAGKDVISGQDPYVKGMALNTPQGMAVFAALAWLPTQLAYHAMLAFFLVGPFALTWLGAAAVRTPGRRTELPASTLALISAVLALSFSYRYGMELGQLGVVCALGLLAAVALRQTRHAWLGGVGLYIGSIKIATMLPFLFLFLRRVDRRIWAAFLALGLSATLAANPPAALLERSRNCLALIEQQSRPGGHNDVSAANSSSVEIISFDRLVYCIGFRGSVARGISLTCVFLFGAGLLFVALQGRYLTEPALVALVSVYATLFLYHRIYDTVLLTGTMVWAMGKAATSDGRGRWAAIGICLAILSVWFVRVGTLRTVVAATHDSDGLFAAFASAVILPYPIWVLIVASVLIVVADRASGKNDR